MDSQPEPNFIEGHQVEHQLEEDHLLEDQPVHNHYHLVDDRANDDHYRTEAQSEEDRSA